MKEWLYKNKKMTAAAAVAIILVVIVAVLLLCSREKNDVSTLSYNINQSTEKGTAAGKFETEKRTNSDDNDEKEKTESKEILETPDGEETQRNSEDVSPSATDKIEGTDSSNLKETMKNHEEIQSTSDISSGNKTEIETTTPAYNLPSGEQQYVFIHPGILYTQNSIEYMKYAVENKISPNYDTWIELLNSPLSSTDWSPRAVETIVRGGNGDNVSRLYIDVARAYQCALIWKISGDTAHGQTACRILNNWSATLKTVTGNADRYLASGLFGYQLANVSELMRDHPDFKVEQMQNMLLNVFYYPLNERFLVGNQYGADHNDAYISNYWANWDLCNMASAMAIGIFCERQDIYNKAVKYYQSGLGNGSLYNAIPYVYEDGTAQWQESGRDQGHTNLGLGLMACICEMAWSQGDDLYGMSDNRLFKAAEYIAKYNNGNDVIFSEYEWGSGTKGDIMYHYVISQSGRGEIRPIWSMIYNHYSGRMGLSSPNIAKRLEAVGYKEYGAVSGGHATTYDQPGWGSLTYAGNTGAKTSGNDISKNIAEGTYRIVSVHTGKALSTDNSGKLCQRTKGNEQSQYWKITYVGGGEYKLENEATGKAMTVEGCSYANGGIITTSDYTEKINQRFAILSADSGNYRIIASNSGKAIDIKDWSGDDNAVIFQWRYVQGNNQKWILEKIK